MLPAYHFGPSTIVFIFKFRGSLMFVTIELYFLIALVLTFVLLGIRKNCMSSYRPHSNFSRTWSLDSFLVFGKCFSCKGVCESLSQMRLLN